MNITALLLPAANRARTRAGTPARAVDDAGGALFLRGAIFVAAFGLASCTRVVAPAAVPAPSPAPRVVPVRSAADSIADAAASAQLLAARIAASTLRPSRAEDVGMRVSTLDSLDYMIMDMLHAGAAPGASIAVGRHGRIVKMGGYGVLDLRPGFGTVTDSTIYDLASLTKVVGTTTAIMMLIDDGKLQLDAPVKQYIPEWSGTPEKEAVTLRNLLLHNSGLPAGGPLYDELRGRDAYRARIASMDLVYAPGTKTVYSDLGGIMMGLIVEQVSGQTLDTFLHNRLFGPLGMNETGFNPLQWHSPSAFDVKGPREQTFELSGGFLKSRIAPTEFSATIGMGAPLQGVVHDENAWSMGGVSGHAGLFSSARDLAVFAQMMLNHGYYAGHRFIQAATVDTFTHRSSDLSSRALGWDTPTPGSSAGDYFSPSSYGHTGYTGTSIWVDPEHDVFVVLLTNRVNPSSDNEKHLALRRMVADQVQKAIVDLPVEKRADIRRQD